MSAAPSPGGGPRPLTVWVVGAAGMLGQEVVRSLEADTAGGGATASYGAATASEVTAGVAPHVLATDREVDFTDPAAVEAYWDEHGPIDWVVNCAAWTAVDAAEEQEAAAASLNVAGPRVLAATAAERGAAMVHISTDYVFSGEADAPYAPEAPTDPRSAYGRTKRDGEIAVRKALDRHVIIRTAWLYGPGGKNFVYTMLRLMNERDSIGVVADQRGLPTYAPDLAAAVAAIVRGSDGQSAAGGSGAPWGTYHYTNAPAAGEEREGISWFDFATEIYTQGRAAGLISSDCAIKALTTAEYPTPAARPAYSVLDCSSTTASIGLARPEWRESLRRFLDVIDELSMNS